MVNGYQERRKLQMAKWKESDFVFSDHFKGTATPWEKDEIIAGPDHLIGAHQVIHIFNQETIQYAMIADVILLTADANLIAAAPDLLEAALKMQAYCRENLMATTGFGMDRAIAKALGHESTVKGEIKPWPNGGVDPGEPSNNINYIINPEKP